MSRLVELCTEKGKHYPCKLYLKKKKEEDKEEEEKNKKSSGYFAISLSGLLFITHRQTDTDTHTHPSLRQIRWWC
jgi:hypothetical protein